MNPLIESLTEKERRYYSDSLLKNLFRMARRQKPDGIAGARSAHLDKQNGDFPFGSEYEIKTSIELLSMHRALGASAGSTGGLLMR